MFLMNVTKLSNFGSVSQYTVKVEMSVAASFCSCPTIDIYLREHISAYAHKLNDVQIFAA